MNMKRLLVIILFLISLGLNAQMGGRHREHKNQRKVSPHRVHSGWHFKPTKPGRMQSYHREGKNLFQWNRTANKRLKYKLQGRINRTRARKRIHGNDVFYKRKYR